MKIIPAVRRAFRVEPFAQVKGVRSGLTREETMELVDQFQLWMADEKKDGGAEPKTATPIPAASAP